MRSSFSTSLDQIDANAWNALATNSNLFLKHDFLSALEKHQCLQRWGWQPQYFLIHQDDELVGASPTYIKDNSYGEFVFDWAWADAYQRNQLNYYPKFVTAIPYTPAQGTRLLSKNNDEKIKQLLIQATIDKASNDHLSSAHWLFCDEADMQALKSQDLLTRFDYQYHWHNQDYTDFNHFLDQLSSRKRKNIKRERRKVKEAGITINTKRGDAITEAEWKVLYHLYCLTFIKKSGTPTMTLAFFQAMAHRLLAIFAEYDNKIVACAICFIDDNALYGRHWGCYEEFDSLHFEVCYYSGIEYCINHKIQLFEPGAQGEHKISRGFVPVKTQSAHWIAHPAFRDAIADFLDREHKAMDDYGHLLNEAIPYKIKR